MKNDDKQLVIVGIGASAGGLEALQKFLTTIPDNTNIAYIIAQHLSPTYKSMLVDLLDKGTEHNVVEAEHDLEIKPDYIYVCPPNKNIYIENDKIQLKELIPGLQGPKPSVDIFFESLAREKQDRAVGIILSGTGSDGSRGVRAIKAAGGYVLAEDPSSAKYDGMPNAAINTGNIDLILPPEQMGLELIELLSYPSQALHESSNLFSSVYNNIVTKLYEVTGVDFGAYKPSTIQRRIERRMAALKVVSVNEYYNVLSKNSKEVESLFKDTLIGVTGFFRDDEAFKSIQGELENYIKEHNETTNIRVWAPGCSTGEEAYSLAIVIKEIIKDDYGKYKVQIFATDIDENALSFARKGLYPESALMDLSKDVRKRYFIAKSDQYEVVKHIREMVIFSRHNIIKDPPFLKLDMVVCRNLLIYFTQELQKKLFPNFHYALKNSGLLFLGKSESVGHFSNYFKTVDKKWKIYNASYLGEKRPPSQMTAFDMKQSKEQESAAFITKRPSILEQMQEFIDRNILPMCVVINDMMDIVYIKGKNHYLLQPEGEPTNNIFKNVIPSLSVELRSAIHQCEKEKDIVKTNFTKVLLADELLRFVRMTVAPINAEKDFGLMMICFQEENNDYFKSYEFTGSTDESEVVKQLEFELARTKEHLQTVIEELETSNEEMQSLNEELQSSNEELQSSNEELETTNEELQSINEELQTAYTEMRAMYDRQEEHTQAVTHYKDQLEQMNDRLEIVLFTSKMGVFDFALPSGSTDYWSDEFAEVLGFDRGELPHDMSKTFNWFTERIDDDYLDAFNEGFQALIDGKFDNFTHHFKIKKRDKSDIWIIINAFVPKRDDNNVALRVVGGIQDATHEHNQLNLLQDLDNQKNIVHELSDFGIWEWELTKDRVVWSHGVYEIFGLNHDVKEIDFDLAMSVVHPDDMSMIEEKLKYAIVHHEKYEVYYRVNNPKKGELHVRAVGRVSYDGETPMMVYGSVQDITSVVRYRDQVTTIYEQVKEYLGASFSGVYIYDIANNKNSFINEQYTALTGYTLEELDDFGEAFFNLFHPEDQENVSKHIAEVLQSQKSIPYSVRYRFKHKDGHWVWLYSSDMVFERNENGEPISMIGSFSDVSQEQQNILNAKVADESFSILNSAIFTEVGLSLSTNSDVKFEYVNDAFCEILGYTKDELHQLSFYDITAEEDRESSAKFMRAALAGEQNSFHTQKYYKTKQGETILVNTNVLVVRDKEDKIQAFWAMIEKE